MTMSEQLRRALIDAMKLAEAESARWKGRDDRTSTHWWGVANDIRELLVGDDLDHAVEATASLRAKALKAEEIPPGLMDFRMRVSE